jgi:hypothetical protein
MLGLLDLLRAVKGTVTLAVRRIHPVVGGVMVAVLWMGALGGMFTLTRDDPAPAPAPQAASHADHERVGTDGSTTTSNDDDEPGADWSQRSEWTPADGATTTTTAVIPAGDLAAPAGSVPSTRPPTPRSDPSWRTTSTTSTTTVPGAPSSTTTTTAPPSSGGLLGGLVDLLGLGKR